MRTAAEMRTQGFFVSVRCRRNNRRGDDELLKHNWVELVISGRTDSDGGMEMGQHHGKNA